MGSQRESRHSPGSTTARSCCGRAITPAQAIIRLICIVFALEAGVAHATVWTPPGSRGREGNEKQAHPGTAPVARSTPQSGSRFGAHPPTCGAYGFDKKSGFLVAISTGTDTCSCTISH